MEKSKANAKTLLTASDLAKRLQVSKSLAYQLMKTGEIRTVKIRKCIRVTEDDLAEGTSAIAGYTGGYEMRNNAKMWVYSRTLTTEDSGSPLLETLKGV